jgi:putative transposase
MCAKLEVSRSGFYAWVRRGPSAHQRRDEGLERLVAEHFSESNGVYGSPRIHALLRRRGERVGRKRVVRLMQRLHLRARANRVYRPRGCAPVCRLNLPNEARCRSVTGPD